MQVSIADICDNYDGEIQVAEDRFKSYGGRKSFFGKIRTIKINRNNSYLIQLLKEDGENQVAVVDVDAEYVAVVGDILMGIAKDNNWAGIVINGYVRDTVETAKIDVGLFALGTCPQKEKKVNSGEIDVDISFASVNFISGDYLYADSDGLIVTKKFI